MRWYVLCVRCFYCAKRRGRCRITPSAMGNVCCSRSVHVSVVVHKREMRMTRRGEQDVTWRAERAAKGVVDDDIVIDGEDVRSSIRATRSVVSAHWPSLGGRVDACRGCGDWRHSIAFDAQR
jgi:hypothetical protein